MAIKLIIQLIICSLFSYGCQNTFYKATQAIENQGKEIVKDWRTPTTYYSELLKRYKLIISYRSFNPEGGNLDNRKFIFCYNSSTSYKGYVYLEYWVHSDKPSTGLSVGTKIDSIQIDKKSADSILNEFKNTEGWNLNYNDTVEDSVDNFCYSKTQNQCFISNGKYYRLEMIYNNKSAVSVLYAPERYESECCWGNINRVKFLRIKSVMDNPLRPILLQ